MSQSRLDALTSIARDDPESAVVWYGLASEYAKAEKWNEAVEALQKCLKVNPSYTAAYQTLGTLLSKQNRKAEAREAWEKGCEIAEQTGAWKAKQHMEGLLKELAPETRGFCAGS
jgi:predicted Zn-dependent protease